MSGYTRLSCTCCLVGAFASFDYIEAHRVTTILHRLSAERIKFITEFEDYEVAMRSVDADGSFILRALSSLIEISMDELRA